MKSILKALIFSSICFSAHVSFAEEILCPHKLPKPKFSQDNKKFVSFAAAQAFADDIYAVTRLRAYPENTNFTTGVRVEFANAPSRFYTTPGVALSDRALNKMMSKENFNILVDCAQRGFYSLMF